MVVEEGMSEEIAWKLEEEMQGIPATSVIEEVLEQTCGHG
jgi:hypothetical protein